MPDLPLTGLRVLDLSRLLPGPYCTMLLSSLGADVIKIETPTLGDYARHSLPEIGGQAMFEIINRDKKSLALNYRNPRGREILLQLAREADILFETFRPGAMHKWKMDYGAVRQVNPRIIYCSLSGYGQAGPYADRAGHDLNYMALAGLLGLNGMAGGPPVPVGIQVADLSGGMLAAISILAAVVGRQHTGQGAYLDVAMLDAAVSWLAPIAGAYFLALGRNPERGRMALGGGLPCYNVYETADGQFLTLGALEPNFWTAFCQTIGRTDLTSRQYDPALIPDVVALFREKSRAEWLAAFREVDACLEPVNTVEEMTRDPQVRYRGLVARAETPAGPALQFGPPFQFARRSDSSPAPTLGQHTIEVLQSAGLSLDDIRDLEAAGIVRTA